MYIYIHAHNENYLPHHSCSAMCYIVLIKITLNMHASAMLTCSVCQMCGPGVSTLCAHYNPLALFVATTHNTNSQKRGVGVGGGEGVNRHDILH